MFFSWHGAEATYSPAKRTGAVGRQKGGRKHRKGGKTATGKGMGTGYRPLVVRQQKMTKGQERPKKELQKIPVKARSGWLKRRSKYQAVVGEQNQTVFLYSTAGFPKTVWGCG